MKSRYLCYCFFAGITSILCIISSTVFANKVVVLPLNDKMYVLPIPFTTKPPPSSVPTVVSKTGRVWMDRNLGASRVAISFDDSLAYGDLYQWGRLADGHESRTSPTTSTISTTDIPGHGSFILGNNTPSWDWRTPQNDNLWQGVSGTNNPCPAGFRLPTETELEIERVSWGSNDRAGAFASPLKLVAASSRFFHTGTIGLVKIGYYWSSTVSYSGSMYLSFRIDHAHVSRTQRADGFSVRCIKD